MLVKCRLPRKDVQQLNVSHPRQASIGMWVTRHLKFGWMPELTDFKPDFCQVT